MWDGVDWVDCCISIDEFIGEDCLLWLCWLCLVFGVMLISEVGDVVVGWGFVLLYEGFELVDIV